MLREQRSFFLAPWAIAFALSCVYGRSLLTGELANVNYTTETDSDAVSPAPDRVLNNMTLDDFEDSKVAPPLPPSTTMPVPSESIEEAANAAAETVLETQCRSRESCADNGVDAVDQDRGDSSSGAAYGSRARPGRAGVTGSRPPLQPAVRAASARGRSTIAVKKQLILDRARARGLNID